MMRVSRVVNGTLSSAADRQRSIMYTALRVFTTVSRVPAETGDNVLSPDWLTQTTTNQHYLLIGHHS